MKEETQEDFEWLLRELVEGGGEAFVCEARLIDGLSDEEVRRLLDQARDADYREIAKEARALAKFARPRLEVEADCRGARAGRSAAQRRRTSLAASIGSRVICPSAQRYSSGLIRFHRIRPPGPKRPENGRGVQASGKGCECIENSLPSAWRGGCIRC
jgi:hypothetical protein